MLTPAQIRRADRLLRQVDRLDTLVASINSHPQTVMVKAILANAEGQSIDFAFQQADASGDVPEGYTEIHPDISNGVRSGILSALASRRVELITELQGMEIDVA